MQSANGRNLDHIIEGEDIQHKLEDIYKRIAGAENKKYTKLQQSVSKYNSMTSKVPDKLALKN